MDIKGKLYDSGLIYHLLDRKFKQELLDECLMENAAKQNVQVISDLSSLPFPIFVADMVLNRGVNLLDEDLLHN